MRQGMGREAPLSERRLPSRRGSASCGAQDGGTLDGGLEVAAGESLKTHKHRQIRFSPKRRPLLKVSAAI